MPDPIIVRAIIEMLGAPKEYIDSTLRAYIEKIESEGLQVRSKTFEPSAPQGELFSAFVELVCAFNSVDALIAFCFDSLPSSLEILEPDMLELKAFDFSNSLNDLQARLHDIEMQVKRLRSANELLDRNSLELIRNFICHVIKGRPMSPEQISLIVGVEVGDLRPFLDKMVEENRLSVKDGNYFIE